MTKSGDRQRLSTPLYLLKHTQGIVTTATAIGILHLRMTHALYFTACTLATSFTAKGLKRVIKQPRPPGSRVKKTSGMPSTHSASMAFMGTYTLLCSMMLPLYPLLAPSSSGSNAESMTRVWLALLSVGAPLAVMWSRVRLGVHTPAQTVAGAALGIAKAYFWFTLWNGTRSTFGIGLTEDIRNRPLLGTLTLGLGIRVGVPADAFIRKLEDKVLSRFQ